MTSLYLARRDQAQALIDDLLAQADAVWLDLDLAPGRSLLAAGATREYHTSAPLTAAAWQSWQPATATTDLVCGYLAYEASDADLGDDERPGPTLPRALLRHYPWYLLIETEAIFWVGDASADASALRQCQARIGAPTTAVTDFSLTQAFRDTCTAADYTRRFQRIQDYLHAGDAYQVNLCRLWRGTYRGDPVHAYHLLRRLSPSAHGGFLRVAGHSLLCRSPERFLRIAGDQVLSSPIKGTLPRLGDDAEQRARLAACAKNRSENLMIVDLMRHELGRYARTGSVRVAPLFEVRSTAQVHHLVSDVHAELAAGVDPWQVLFGCFPGGSITGAPKLRARQIIRELEPWQRSVYCGSMFYCLAGQIEANIAIRTLIADSAGDLWAYAGGGITAASQPDDEYHECEHKIGAFLHALADAFASAPQDARKD